MGASYDPINRMLYVNCSNEAEWISMVSAKTDTELSLFDFGNKIFKGYCASCHKSSSDSNQENPDLRHLKNLERDTI
ncbi:MAG: cytochrome c2 [Saprospiraceae bacterium]